jgi:hypothetical protein
VSLSLFKFGMLGCLVMDNFQGVGSECLSSDFPWFGWPSGVVGISHVVPPGD